ncbi:hypothetical protein ACFC1R_24550 [Kitasatospora sp. NPDC056138]|uniref:hypothetical protein n=1 Tax=Kitasatospora sp. NPDC056138 TaxID=3345724 RepID=UPI0035E00373
MSPQPNPSPAVSGVLQALLLAPLLVGAGYVFLGLTLFSGGTGDLFAWRMSPVTATLLGAAYGGSGVMLAMALCTEQWVRVRVAVAASSLLMLLMLGACLLGRGTLQLTRGSVVAVLSAWVWLGVHTAAPVVGLIALGAQWRRNARWRARSGRAEPRPPRLPWWVAGPVVGNGLAVTATGLLLYTVPDVLTRHWPWQVSALDVRVIGAWCLAFGTALLLGLCEAELRRVRNGMAALVGTGVLGLVGLLRYAHLVRWASPGSWLVVLALVAFTGLGLCGVGVSGLLDPPRPGSGPGGGPVVRPAQLG